MGRFGTLFCYLVGLPAVSFASAGCVQSSLKTLPLPSVVAGWPPSAEALVVRRSTHPEYNQRLQ